MADEQDEQDEDEYEAAFALYCEKRIEAYHQIFGIEQPQGQIHLAPADLATTCWFGGGVFPFPPTAHLKHWHYVSEAISQPADPVTALKKGDPDDAFELVLSTKTRCNWAPNILMNLARYYFTKRRPFHPYEAIPCGGPLVAGSDSKLTFLISVTAREYEPVIHLPGIECTLVHMVGVAEDELMPALGASDVEMGIRALQCVLYNHGIGSCSIPERPSLAASPGFLDEWKTELERLEAEHR